MENDRNSFWEILQIMGGKPQCSSTKAISDMSDLCKQLLDGIDEKNLEERLKEDLKLYFRDAGLSEKDFDIAALAIPPMKKIKEADIMQCQEMIREALGSESYIRRR